MSRCREVAGVLFKHECRAEAVVACAICRKPVCAMHARAAGTQKVCVTCLRNQLKDPRTRGSYAYLRDDPYFYWYYNDTWFDDPYGADDYALFDSGADTFQGGGGDFGGGGASDDFGGS